MYIDIYKKIYNIEDKDMNINHVLKYEEDMKSLGYSMMT